MRRIKEILRLRSEANLTLRAIARSLNASHSSVLELLRRAEQAGVSWPVPEGLDDEALEAKLYALPERPRAKSPAEPDMNWIHRELKQSRSKNVTLKLLWMEYQEAHPEGLKYSQFCQRYRDWREQLDVTMRHHHKAGEKMFVDFAGETVPVVDPKTGEITDAQIFIAVLGASNYTYAEACASQELHNWLQAHVRAFEYYEGVSEILIPDNVKSGVKHACYYEPDVNRSYQDLAEHYGTVVIPTRSRKPRDKAKAENAVLQAERWILAPLRNETFVSLAQLNDALLRRLAWLNDRPFQKLEGSRRSLYLELDRPALKPLPATRYVFATHRKAAVNIDYHVEVDRRYYSVPYKLVGRRETLDVRVSATSVEILRKGKRIASHLRLARKGQYSTDKDHMPSHHRAHAEWSPSRLIGRGRKVGANAGAFIEAMIERKAHPEQGYRAALGIFRLRKSYGDERLDAACRRALAFEALSYKSVRSILERGLDKASLDAENVSHAKEHDNVRGASYFSGDADPASQEGN